MWRVLRQHGIHLQRRRSHEVSTDPEFSAKAADVVGLYLDPPEKAVVLCVDEKPSIQALERAQGYLRLPNGQAMSGASHRYQRHGTTTLFAALEVATGRIQAGHATRRRRREFLDFMNELVGEYSPEQAIHVVLDNLNTHKPKRDRWRGPSSQRALPLHPHQRLLAESDRDLVQHPQPTRPAGGQLHLAPATARRHRRLHRRLQLDSPALRVEEETSLPYRAA